MSLSIDQYLATGQVAAPRETLLTGRYACYDVYPTRDGKWLSVGAIEPHFYANLCKALGCEQWVSRQTDDDVQDRIRADFAAAFRTRDRDDWVAELASANTCVAPVHGVAELVRDPQFVARGAFSEAHHPEHGVFRQLAPALAGMPRSETPVTVRDGRVTDTDVLLAEAGVSTEEIEKLRGEGIVA